MKAAIQTPAVEKSCSKKERARKGLLQPQSCEGSRLRRLIYPNSSDEIRSFCPTKSQEWPHPTADLCWPLSSGWEGGCSFYFCVRLINSLCCCNWNSFTFRRNELKHSRNLGLRIHRLNGWRLKFHPFLAIVMRWGALGSCVQRSLKAARLRVLLPSAARCCLVFGPDTLPLSVRGRVLMQN